MSRDGQNAPRAWLPVAALMACGAACAGADVREYTERFEHSALPPIEIHATLDQGHQRYATRYIEAARTALNWFGEWYGPYPGERVALKDTSSGAPTDVNAHTLSPSSSRQLEQRVAALLARDYWSPPRGPDLGAAPELREALVAFSVNRLIREAYSGERFVELRVFDDAIPWVVRSVSSGSPPHGASRVFLALLTLERYLGWPALQQSLAEFRTRYAGAPASADSLMAVTADLVGRNLSWLNGVFDRSLSYDYGIDRIDVQGTTDGFRRVEVVVRRYGTGEFTGSALPRTASFESGQGVTVKVSFADGQEMNETWDGRDTERRFVYDSPVAVVSAVVDPDYVIAVDAARANNTFLVADAAAARRSAAVAWAARWAGSLQDRLLLWTALF